MQINDEYERGRCSWKSEFSGESELIASKINEDKRNMLSRLPGHNWNKKSGSKEPLRNAGCYPLELLHFPIRQLTQVFIQVAQRHHQLAPIAFVQAFIGGVSIALGIFDA